MTNKQNKRTIEIDLMDVPIDCVGEIGHEKET